MRPRTRTQHRGVMGIILGEPLAPFLYPGFLSVLSCGLTPGGRPEGIVAASRGARHGLASMLLPWSFPPHEKQTTSFAAPLYLRRWLLLIPRFAMQPPFQKLSRFDEATSPAVTMTESHTQRVCSVKSNWRESILHGSHLCLEAAEPLLTPRAMALFMALSWRFLLTVGAGRARGRSWALE